MGRIALAQLGLQLQQFGALFALDGRKRQRAHSIGGSIRHVLGGDAVFSHAQLDALLKLFASLYAKCFDGRIVHGALPISSSEWHRCHPGFSANSHAAPQRMRPPRHAISRFYAEARHRA